MEGTRLYVGNISRLNERDIREAFEKIGTITDLWLGNESSGFGFISYGSKEEAEQAIRDLDGLDIRGNRIKVEMAKTPRGQGRRHRSYSRGRSYDRYRRRSRSHSRRRRHSPSYSRSRSRHHHSSRHGRDRSSSRHSSRRDRRSRSRHHSDSRE